MNNYFRSSTISVVFIVIAAISQVNAALFFSLGKKDSTKTEAVVEKKTEESTPEKAITIRITAHFTNIFATLEPTPVIRRSVKAGEEFLLLDSVPGYWIIKDGTASAYVGQAAAAIAGSAADTVLTPIIDTLSAADIPEVATPVSAAIDTTIKAEAKAIAADTVSSATEKPAKPFPWFLLLAVILIAGITGASYWTGLRRKALRRVKFRSAILLMNSFDSLDIDYGHHRFSLKKFLLRFGIALDRTRSLATLPGLMAEIEPDFIFVDWRIAPDIVDHFRQLLGQYRLASSITVVFCYVDVAGISQFKNDFGTTPIHVFSAVPTGNALSQILSGNGKPYHRAHDTVETNTYLAGTITDSSIEDVLQLIDTSKKSGSLAVHDEKFEGTIFFHEGTVVHAATKEGTTGIDAIKDILKQNQGNFSFEINAQSDEKSLNHSVMAILMEWSTQKDLAQVAATESTVP